MLDLTRLEELFQAYGVAVVLIAIALITTLAGLVLGSAWSRWRHRRSDRRVRVRRAAKARKGEDRAPRLLRAAGYRILKVQERRRWTFEVDGEPVETLLIADFIVERHGQIFVADAKTGGAASIRSAETRRQLLEYQLVFEVPAVLLVDMHRGGIEMVVFPAARSGEARSDLSK